MAKKKGESGGVHEPAVPDPTDSARLVITMARIGTSAETHVPPAEAHHVITTFGIVATGCAGIGGAVLTVRISVTLSGLALAELAASLVVVFIIAASALAGRGKRRAGGSGAAGGREGREGR